MAYLQARGWGEGSVVPCRLLRTAAKASGRCYNIDGYFPRTPHLWGRSGFDGSIETKVACTGCRWPVKKRHQTIIANDYDYAVAA